MGGDKRMVMCVISKEARREICWLEQNYSVLIVDSNQYLPSTDFSTNLDFCNWKNFARVFEMTLIGRHFEGGTTEKSVGLSRMIQCLSSTDFSTRLDFCNWKNFACVFEMTGIGRHFEGGTTEKSVGLSRIIQYLS